MRAAAAAAPMTRRLPRPGWMVAAVLAVCAAAAPAWADAQWQRLSEAQRAALAPLQAHWSALDAAQREKWLALAHRLPALPASEQALVQDRLAQWAHLSADERRRARLQFDNLRRQHSADERRARWAAYAALDDAERSALASASTAPARAQPAAPPRAAVRPDLAQLAAPPRKLLGPLPPSDAARRPTGLASVQVRPGGSVQPLGRAAQPATPAPAATPRLHATRGDVHPATLLPQRPRPSTAPRTPPRAASPVQAPAAEGPPPQPGS